MKLQFFLLIVGVALAAAKYQVRTREDAKKAHEECRADNRVPDEIYEQFLNFDFPEHKRTNCYMKCFVEKMGLFTVLKGFSEKNIISQFTSDDTKNLETVRHGLEKCIDHNEWESDNCTWVHRVFSCWLKVNRHVIRKQWAPQ